jgi:hypothetical protein
MMAKDHARPGDRQDLWPRQNGWSMAEAAAQREKTRRTREPQESSRFREADLAETGNELREGGSLTGNGIGSRQLSSRADLAVRARGTASVREPREPMSMEKLRNEPNHGAGILANPEAVRTLRQARRQPSVAMILPIRSIVPSVSR